MTDFIGRNGNRQKEFVTLLALINTSFTATLALLDDDTGVAATDYESGQAITFPTTDININGTRQGSITTYLNSLITNLNAVNAKLDADNLQLSDYVTEFNVTDIINDSGKDGFISRNGMPQGLLMVLIDTIITNFNALNAQLVADTTVQTASYTDNDVPDTVDSIS